jgi:hypothetical protein
VLAHRKTPFRLHCRLAADADGVTAAAALVTLPHVRCGVPLWAAGELRRVLRRALRGHDADVASAARTAAREAAPRLAPRLLALLEAYRHDGMDDDVAADVAEAEEAEGEGAAYADARAEDVDPYRPFAVRAARAGHAAAAALALHAVAPCDVAAALAPPATLRLLAACVRGARADDAAHHAAWFAPLLQCALLHRTAAADVPMARRSEAEALQYAAAALCDVVPMPLLMPVARFDDAPPLEAMSFDAMALLLTCGLSHEASDDADEDGGIAAAAASARHHVHAGAAWLAAHADCVLRTLAAMAAAAAASQRARVVDSATACAAAARRAFAPAEAVTLDALSFTIADVATHLAAMARLPALLHAARAAPAFAPAMQQLLATRWCADDNADEDADADADGCVAASRAYAAMHALLACVSYVELTRMLRGWREEAQAAALAAGVPPQSVAAAGDAALAFVALHEDHAALMARTAAAQQRASGADGVTAQQQQSWAAAALDATRVLLCISIGLFLLRDVEPRSVAADEAVGVAAAVV